MFGFGKRDDLSAVFVSADATLGSRASLGQCPHPLGLELSAQKHRAPRSRARLTVWVEVQERVASVRVNSMGRLIRLAATPIRIFLRPTPVSSELLDSCNSFVDQYFGLLKVPARYENLVKASDKSSSASTTKQFWRRRRCRARSRQRVWRRRRPRPRVARQIRAGATGAGSGGENVLRGAATTSGAVPYRAGSAYVNTF